MRTQSIIDRIVHYFVTPGSDQPLFVFSPTRQHIKFTRNTVI